MSKSQRQDDSAEGFCPEACHFCHGVGMASPITMLSEANPYSSCKDWPILDREELNRMDKDTPHWYLPSKFLRGKNWRHLVEKLPEGSELTLLVGDCFFDAEALKEVWMQYPTQIWMIPNRDFDIVSALCRLPEAVFDKVYFYCPLYEIDPDTFLTSQELVRLFKKLISRFPKLEIRAPKGKDLFNPTLLVDNIKCKEKLVFDSSQTGAVDVSVIIPTYNNQDYVCRVVKNLNHQSCNEVSFEVVIVDDGSSDGTLDSLLSMAEKGELPKRVRIIDYPRFKDRRMGDFQFRAGMARRLGVEYSKGQIFAFLDSDILVPPNYIQSLYESHVRDGYEVVQIQRLYLKEQSSKNLRSYEAIDQNKDVFHPEGGYWKKFFADPKPWSEVANRWKYVCTYGLSVKAETYFEVGGFRAVFNSYGFEDTDLGYRLSKNGARFLKSSIQAYHLWHQPSKSEYENSPRKRQNLLARSANIFFRHNLDLEVFEELGSLLLENRSFKQRLRSWRRL